MSVPHTLSHGSGNALQVISRGRLLPTASESKGITLSTGGAYSCNPSCGLRNDRRSPTAGDIDTAET